RVDHLRPLLDRQQPAPLGLAGAGERQPLVPALRAERQQAGMPPADVAAVVGDQQVLVPGQLRRGAAGLLHRARVVERGEPHERLHLAAPDRIAARVGALALRLLHRPVHGPAEALLDRLRARDLERLVAAGHLAGLALEAVALLAGELLDIEVVVVAEAARDAPGDATVVA